MPLVTINFRCNNNCISCINYRKAANSSRDRDWDSIKKILKKLGGKGLTHLDINGGEPTLRRNLPEILEYVSREYPGIEMKLLTNGRMFSYGDYTRKIASLGLDKFTLTVNLYSGDPKINDAITRSPGSWDQTVAGIKNLLEYGFATELRIVVNKLNYRHLPEMAKFINNEFFGLLSVDFVNMKVTGEARKNRNFVLVKYTKSVPYVQRAVDALKEHQNVRLFHFPLCILNGKYRNLAKGVTIDHDITYAPKCGSCKKRKECPMIWKSYLEIVGSSEFEPIV